MPELDVTATAREIARSYDALAPVYDRVIARWEAPTYAHALYALAPRAGERVLDVGCGPGWLLAAVADAVGPSGRVYGLDAAPRMAERAARRLEASEKAGSQPPGVVVTGDARALPFADASLDAVVLTETLELFSATDAMIVLEEIQRVLRPDGRLVVTSMERRGFEQSAFVRAYEWAYARVPGYAAVGCRPVDVRGRLTDAGLTVESSETYLRAGGWPTTVAVARP